MKHDNNALATVQTLPVREAPLSITEKFNLPEGFEILDTNITCPLKQTFSYAGSLNAYDAINALSKAGQAVGGRGAGRNTGNDTYYIVEKSIYSHD